MPDIYVALGAVLEGRYSANLARIHQLAEPLIEKQFWTKPFPFGNSFGHLVLHLTGNLNYYIGAQIANSGYIREREREFAESNPPAKADALKRLDDAVAMVAAAIRGQSSTDWTRAYSAVGTNCGNRLDIVMQCAAHMQHHIGQMIYLTYELKR